MTLFEPAGTYQCHICHEHDCNAMISALALLQVDVEQGYKKILNVITKKLRLPRDSSGYKLYNLSKTEYYGDLQCQQVKLEPINIVCFVHAVDHHLTMTACCIVLQLKDDDLVLVSRGAHFKVPHGSSSVINTTPYAGFYP